MTEEDTFVRLSRASFEEVFLNYGEGLQLDPILFYLASRPDEKEPPRWQERFPGWTWEEFQQECKRMIGYE